MGRDEIEWPAGCGVSAVSALLNYDSAESGMLWATRGHSKGAEKQLKWNLSVCKVHDVFYGVMGFEKILDWLWWKDELKQVAGNVIHPAAIQEVHSSKVTKELHLVKYCAVCDQ